MVEMENKENSYEDCKPVKISELKVKILPMKDDEEQCKLKVIEDGEENEEEIVEDFEEPVSPPPCSPSEAPKLLMSQTIEVRKFNSEEHL